MKRREFITVIGGAAAWPLAGFAQTLARRPVVGCVVAGSKTGTERVFGGFLQGMRDLGYVEGQNWILEDRYTDGDQARVQSLAEELVRIKPDVLVSERGHERRPPRTPRLAVSPHGPSRLFSLCGVDLGREEMISTAWEPLNGPQRALRFQRLTSLDHGGCEWPL